MTLACFLRGPHLLPGAGPTAPRAGKVTLGIVMKMVLASQAHCMAPGDLQGPQTTQNPYPGGGGLSILPTFVK